VFRVTDHSWCALNVLCSLEWIDTQVFNRYRTGSSSLWFAFAAGRAVSFPGKLVENFACPNFSQTTKLSSWSRLWNVCFPNECSHRIQGLLKWLSGNREKCCVHFTSWLRSLCYYSVYTYAVLCMCGLILEVNYVVIVILLSSVGAYCWR
jgi:hypothetical protein